MIFNTNPPIPIATTLTAGGVIIGNGLTVNSTGTISVNLAASDIPNLSASKITTGIFNIDQIPTGTTSTSVAIGNHTHGNITNTGDITAAAPTIANGDQLIINDNSASKITNGPTFDGSTTTKALTPKGTWETFSQFSGSYNDLTNTPTIPVNTDTKLQIAIVTSGTTYYPIVGTGTTAATRQYDSSGFVYVGTNGTANGTNGNSLLTLGNSTASTSANWKKGTIRLYGTTTYYTDLVSGAPTANRTITLPNATGTVALTSDIPAISYPVTSVNNKTGAVSLTASDVGALPSSTSIPSNYLLGVYPTTGSGNNTQWAQNFNTRIYFKAGTNMGIALDNSTLTFNATVPTKVSDLTNDLGYITSYTETDPTVPSWAKASAKPTYTASEVGAANSSHTHGNITNAGDITATATIANGDRIVINDESASKITNSSITFGTGTTTFLANNGTWQTPVGTYTLPTATTSSLGGIQVGTGLTAANNGTLSINTDNSITTTSSTNYPTTSAVVSYVEAKEEILISSTQPTAADNYKIWIEI